MYELRIFKTYNDINTNKKIKFNSLNDLENFLSELSKISGYKPGSNNKKISDNSCDRAILLLSSAIYSPNTTRCNRNVLGWSRLVFLDIDDYKGNYKDIINNISFYNICYSTPSSTEEKPKFRIVLPLTDVIDKKDIPLFWYGINIELLNIVDAQTKDLSRMFFAPAKVKGAFNFFIINNNKKILDPQYIIDKYNKEYNNNKKNNFINDLPSGIQSDYIKFKQNKLSEISNKTWTSYKNCPYVSQKLVMEYKTISETGWYAKLYAIMVSIGGNAVKDGYNISPFEIAKLCHELDNETGGWYKKRPLELEAQRAINYILMNG